MVNIYLISAVFVFLFAAEVPLRKVLMGDSILRYIVGRIRGLDVKCYPGCKITQMKEKMSGMLQYLRTIHYIGVHVGTNNIQTFSEKQIIDQLKDLLTHMIKTFPNATIVFSSILPRPKDEYLNHRVVHRINDHLLAWCNHNSVICLRTFSPLSFRGWADPACFSRDGLHPNARGVDKLVSFYSQQMGDKMLRTRSQALRDNNTE